MFRSYTGCALISINIRKVILRLDNRRGAGPVWRHRRVGMSYELLIGSAIILVNVVVSALFMGIGAAAVSRAGTWLVRPPHAQRLVVALAALALWVQAGISVCVWVWAWTFLWLGVFTQTEEAVYFSMVAFTTLGFGDILLPLEWRNLSGLAAANGLVTFGLYTAFMVEMIRQIRREQVSGLPERG